MRVFIGLFFCGLLATACSTIPRFDHQKIRPWSEALSHEEPGQKVVIAHYQKDEFELFYLAARHTNTIGDDTLELVQTLFDRYKFNVLVIESIPFSFGESPQWFIEEAKAGKSKTSIKGGESAFAAILADERKIPFYAGEPDHEDVYRGLRKKGYTDEDIIAFYTIRQIPQWVRENEDRKTLLQRKIPPFAEYYCQIFSIQSCPDVSRIKKWYEDTTGRPISVDVSNEEVAPYSNGRFLAQRISADVGVIRDRFTLSVLNRVIGDYRKVAVVYGAGHFFTLRKSFDESFGEPTFVEFKGR